MKLTDWTLPLRTADLDMVDLAQRVKFESNSLVRYLTHDNRDILYKLDKDGKHVHYISEVKIDNSIKQEGHKLTLSQEKGTFDQIVRRNSQIMASC